MIAYRDCRRAQPFHPVQKQAEVPQVFILEELVLVLLKLLRKIEQLFVMHPEVAYLTSYLVRTLGRHVLLFFDYAALYIVELILVLFKQGAVRYDDLLEKIVNEPLKAGEYPLLAPADAVYQLLSFAAVVYEYDALFIKRKAEYLSRVPVGKLLPVGDAKGAGQRIVVDLRLGRDRA